VKVISYDLKDDSTNTDDNNILIVHGMQTWDKADVGVGTGCEISIPGYPYLRLLRFKTDGTYDVVAT
jgi:hypothetical protein